MSSGAVFNLISSTSQTDRLLYAMDYLKERINTFIINKDPDITEQDLAALPQNDKYLKVNRSILPSLNEIEKSHVTFVNGSYKPSIPLASEYIKIQHTNPKFGSSIYYQMPQIGQFTSDCMIHVRLSGMSAIDQRDRVRYVAMLGHRLIKHTQFLVNNGNIIDEYGTDDYNAYYHYELLDHHKIGYLRNIGQEVPYTGYITADPLNDMFREYKLIGDGNQTLKYSHDAIDLFIPVLFWFKDVKNALPRLPWGQLQIKVDLADVSDIVGFFDGGGGGNYNPPTIEFCDLYVNQLFTVPEIFDLYAKKFVFSIIRTHRAHKQTITAAGNKEYQVLLNNLKWPTEALYFSFRPRENLTLSQYWYKSCSLVEKTYKTPVVAKNPDSVFIVTPVASPNPTTNSIAITSTSILSTTDDAYNEFDLVITSGTGYNPTNIEQNKYTVKSYNGANKIITIYGVWAGKIPDTTTALELYTPQLAINKVTYYLENPVVNKISLEASGIEIFKSNVEAFYNTYTPMRFKDANIPTDCGMYMMPFCTKLYSHDPSGSINISLCRELYLKFTSDLISKAYPVDLICLSRCINFLLVDSNVGMTLKYCT